MEQHGLKFRRIMKNIILALILVFGFSVNVHAKYSTRYEESTTQGYYEVIENQGIDVFGEKIKEKIKWKKVKDKKDALKEHNKISNKTSLLGKKYKAKYHIHRHALNGNNRPCTTELIEEVL